MAYLVSLSLRCNADRCTSKYSVQLFDWINESRGKFCKKHGKQMLAEREKFEKENPHCRGG